MSEDRDCGRSGLARGGGLPSAREFLSRRPHAIPAILTAALLLGALAKWPYDYYRLLRWVTCAASVFVAYHGWAWKRPWAAWVFGAVAVLFNPLWPIHLKRQTWQVIHVATAALFIAGAAVVAKPKSQLMRANEHTDQ